MKHYASFFNSVKTITKIQRIGIDMVQDGGSVKAECCPMGIHGRK